MSRPKTVYTFVTFSGIVRVSDGRCSTDNDACHEGRVVAIRTPRFDDITDPDVPFVSRFDTEFSKSGLERIEDLEQAINYVAGVIP